jgi:four helix bundle protein
MRNFRELAIWEKGIRLAVDAYHLTSMLPKKETYGMKSQITRAATSIPSNIAEGCSRRTNIDFTRFLNHSLGSSFELETQLIVCSEVGLLSNESVNDYLNRFHLEQKRINSLVTKLK